MAGINHIESRVAAGGCLPIAKDSSPDGALYVRTVRGMGRGVFAGRRFGPGELIEACPVLLIPESLERKCRDEMLEHYIFAWNKTGDVAAVALGYGSLYNHSPDPNAVFKPKKRAKVIEFRAKRTIQKGEQIFVNYEWEAKDYHFPTPSAAARRGS